MSVGELRGARGYSKLIRKTDCAVQYIAIFTNVKKMLRRNKIIFPKGIRKLS